MKSLLSLTIAATLSWMTNLSSINSLQAAELTINYSGLSQEQIATVETWIHSGIGSVELTLSTIPQNTLTIEVMEKSGAREPVPWARVVRGSPIKVELHVDANAKLDEFIQDWTLYHELSHLYLPLLNVNSFWLNEGFATYMQYLVMLRAQIITQAQYLARLESGFKRGGNTTLSHPGKLSEVAADMWQRGAFKRVYWSGAAYFAQIDQALIAQGSDLTQVIELYSRCCLRKYSSGWQLVKQLDRISDSEIFTSHYLQYSQRRDFPSISKQTLQQISLHYSAQAQAQTQSQALTKRPRQSEKSESDLK